MIMSLKNKACFSGKSPSSSLPMRQNLGGGGRDGIVAHIAELNDAAIYKWAVDNDRQEARALLTQALHRVNALSKTLLSRQQQRWRKRSIAQATTTTSSKKSAMKHKSGTAALDTAAQDPFIVPLPVDIDTKCVNVCFNKAFLLKASVTSGGGRTTADQMESVFIAAAVVLYNVALFFQHQHNSIAEPSPSPHHLQQRQQQDQPAAAAALPSPFHESYVEKYYRVADKVLSEYMKFTRRPLWTLQAAIWYNLADSTRFQQAVTPASCRYFGQLETIMELLPDPDDLMFFKHHIAVARMQMAHCYCAVVA
jgi:hypothetical protein